LGGLVEDGRMDQAIEAFEKALEINADIPDAWCNMGLPCCKNAPTGSRQGV